MFDTRRSQYQQYGRWRSQTNGPPVESMLGWMTGEPDNVPGIVLE